MHAQMFPTFSPQKVSQVHKNYKKAMKTTKLINALYHFDSFWNVVLTKHSNFLIERAIYIFICFVLNILNDPTHQDLQNFFSHDLFNEQKHLSLLECLLDIEFSSFL